MIDTYFNNEKKTDSKMFKKTVTFLVCLIPFNIVKILLLKFIGHRVSFSSRIGVSLVFVPRIDMEKGASIGSFNFIRCNGLQMGKKSKIKKLNIIKGSLLVKLGNFSGVSYLNKIGNSNAQEFIDNQAVFKLGMNSFIVRSNFLDITRSIKIGENSILAGKGTQLWTHGFYHADQGHERVRIDGSINIGNNVYVGSSCIFNPGVSVGNSIHIGAGSVISKDLDKPGMYVSQGLRHIENSLEKIKSKLQFSHKHPLGNDIYTKD